MFIIKKLTKKWKQLFLSITLGKGIPRKVKENKCMTFFSRTNGISSCRQRKIRQILSYRSCSCYISYIYRTTYGYTYHIHLSFIVRSSTCRNLCWKIDECDTHLDVLIQIFQHASFIHHIQIFSTQQEALRNYVLYELRIVENPCMREEALENHQTAAEEALLLFPPFFLGFYLQTLQKP